MSHFKKTRRLEPPTRLLFCLALLAVFLFALPACNVTRTVSTQSQWLQRGDTAVMIQTKTIEVYDASKKM